jgi:glycosyltransferase involved in cell wall biosynthesis
LFEYIVAGIPVVASDFPELRRVIEEFKVGCTFNPDDPKDIARAISWVFEDEKRLVELKENARRAAAVLNWENEEKKLLELYRKLLP